MRTLTFALVATALALTWLVWNTGASVARIEAVTERALRVEGLRGTIVLLDEVLTMSARMAAATGDPQWEARYRTFDPQLTAAIAEAQSLAPSVASMDVVARTDAANTALVRMETHAFDLVRQRRLEEARAVLSSGEYARQKGIYAAGMDTLDVGLKKSVQGAVAVEVHRSRVVLVFSVAALLLLVLYWIVALRTMHRWRVALLANQERLSTQSAELAQLNANLDNKVAERTAEVESSRAVALVNLEEAQRARAVAETAEQELLVAIAAAESGSQRLAILHEIDRAILAVDSPTTVAETALHHFRRLVHAPRVVLALYDFATGEGTRLAVDVEGPTERPAGTHFPLEWMGDLDALRRDVVQIVEVPSLGHLPEGQAAAAEGIRSFAVVPLLAEGRLIGSLNVSASAPGGPSAQDLVVAREIAAQLAIALQQSHLHQDVKESRDMLVAVVDSAPLAIITTDLTSLVTSWNPAAARLFGWTPDEVLGRPLPIIPADRRAEYEGLLAGYQRAEAVTNIEITRLRKDGSLVDVVLSAAPILDVHGRPLGAMGVYADITQRKQLEQELRQAQKMDAIGQLAGGVAHDFNNLLTVIGGRSTLLLQKMQPDDPTRRHVELIERTSQRAAGLTRQLLAFSRKQVLALAPLDLNTLVAGVMPMLRRLIGEHIEFVVVPGRDVGHVMADVGQMEQVVMNLVVNARDAMSEGGTVKIETAGQAVLEARFHSQGQVPPGQYVTLSVQDTGSGIDSVTLAQIFEPFFTTKDAGTGTGLGLSTVHGIVHQSGGFIAVDSTLGRGTTFTIYLPRIAEPMAVTNAPKDTPQALMRGTETVLLVEDEEDVRKVGSEILQACGYTVLDTGDPLEALTIGERRNGAIDLLVTDMVMPGMGGEELATRLEAMSPGLHVLCVSGYADQIAVVTAGHPARACLRKPFTPYDLARKVREALTPASAP
jgi:PAS domain S-box-containing protein